MTRSPAPDAYLEPRLRNEFRRRLLLLLLILLLVLLLARCAANRLSPGPPPAPTQADSTTTPVPSPTITNLPDFLFTPQITFTAIPPATAALTPTPTPRGLPQDATPTPTGAPTGAPSLTSSPSPTTAPAEITRRACSGYGRIRGKEWIVAGCDTLLRISQVTGISLEQLLRANPEITDPNLIYPNQRILLPAR